MTLRYTPDTVRLDRIKPWMQSYVDERKFAGSSVLITQGGTEVFFHATGQRDIDRALPFTRDTRARIYSMTKPITSVAIMMLAERGLFHLDAPVSDFLPAYADMRALVPGASLINQTEPCATPTLHQLMTHTSGLSYPFNTGVLPRAMDEVDLLFKPDQGLLGIWSRNSRISRWRSNLAAAGSIQWVSMCWVGWSKLSAVGRWQISSQKKFSRLWVWLTLGFLFPKARAIVLPLFTHLFLGTLWK